MIIEADEVLHPQSFSDTVARHTGVSRRSFGLSLLIAGAALPLAACKTLRSPEPLPLPPPELPPVLPQDMGLLLQLYLDGKNFSPGVVDGKPGQFTQLALGLYREANALPEGWQPDLRGIYPFREYTVTAEDMKTIGPMADTPEERSKLSRLPYVSLIEALAERFHTSQSFLRNANPGVGINSLTPGALVKVPNIQDPFRMEDYPSGYPALEVGAEHRQVTADTRARMLQVREGGQILAAFPITPGSSQHPAPKGEWKITGAVANPWYRYDEGVLKRGERTETYFNLPPGPNSPVGILWAGLNRPGIGIHGSPNPETIGRAGSHGCIRLTNWDAAKFRTMVNKGTAVTIQ